MTRPPSDTITAPRSKSKDAPETIDWDAEKDRIDLAAVIAREIGKAIEKNGRPWHRCPFHDDHQPSLVVRKFPDGRQRWKCYGCGARGDVAAFIMMLRGASFLEAIAYLTDGKAPACPSSPVRRESRKAPKQPQPDGWQKAAMADVDAAERRLWMDEGAEALGYLHGRGLTEGTIRAARLGFIRVGRTGVPSGITIPWFDGDRLTMVNVRRPMGSDPKYMLFSGSRRGGIYPGPNVVRPGKTLVIVEGELDALLLGQELAGLASVVTLGCASDQADHGVLNAILPASPWFAATDADEAGDRAAAPWLAYERCRRIKPPGSFKDWNDAALGGVNLRRWWQEAMAGAERPQLFTWEELSTWRWGPGLEDAEPGIVIGRAMTGGQAR